MATVDKMAPGVPVFVCFFRLESDNEGRKDDSHVVLCPVGPRQSQISFRKEVAQPFIERAPEGSNLRDHYWIPGISLGGGVVALPGGVLHRPFYGDVRLELRHDIGSFPRHADEAVQKVWNADDWRHAHSLWHDRQRAKRGTEDAEPTAEDCGVEKEEAKPTTKELGVQKEGLDVQKEDQAVQNPKPVESSGPVASGPMAHIVIGVRPAEEGLLFNPDKVTPRQRIFWSGLRASTTRIFIRPGADVGMVEYEHAIGVEVSSSEGLAEVYEVLKRGMASGFLKFYETMGLDKEKYEEYQNISGRIRALNADQPDLTRLGILSVELPIGVGVPEGLATWLSAQLFNPPQTTGVKAIKYISSNTPGMCQLLLDIDNPTRTANEMASQVNHVLEELDVGHVVATGDGTSSVQPLTSRILWLHAAQNRWEQPDAADSAPVFFKMKCDSPTLLSSLLEDTFGNAVRVVPLFGTNDVVVRCPSVFRELMRRSLNWLTPFKETIVELSAAEAGLKSKVDALVRAKVDAEARAKVDAKTEHVLGEQVPNPASEPAQETTVVSNDTDNPSAPSAPSTQAPKSIVASTEAPKSVVVSVRGLTSSDPKANTWWEVLPYISGGILADDYAFGGSALFRVDLLPGVSWVDIPKSVRTQFTDPQTEATSFISREMASRCRTTVEIRKRLGGFADESDLERLQKALSASPEGKIAAVLQKIERLVDDAYGVALYGITTALDVGIPVKELGLLMALTESLSRELHVYGLEAACASKSRDASEFPRNLPPVEFDFSWLPNTVPLHEVLLGFAASRTAAEKASSKAPSRQEEVEAVPQEYAFSAGYDPVPDEYTASWGSPAQDMHPVEAPPAPLPGEVAVDQEDTNARGRRLQRRLEPLTEKVARDELREQIRDLSRLLRRQRANLRAGAKRIFGEVGERIDPNPEEEIDPNPESDYTYEDEEEIQNMSQPSTGLGSGLTDMYTTSPSIGGPGSRSGTTPGSGGNSWAPPEGSSAPSPMSSPEVPEVSAPASASAKSFVDALLNDPAIRMVADTAQNTSATIAAMRAQGVFRDITKSVLKVLFGDKYTQILDTKGAEAIEALVTPFVIYFAATHGMLEFLGSNGDKFVAEASKLAFNGNALVLANKHTPEISEISAILTEKIKELQDIGRLIYAGSRSAMAPAALPDTAVADQDLVEAIRAKMAEALR